MPGKRLTCTCTPTRYLLVRVAPNTPIGKDAAAFGYEESQYTMLGHKGDCQLSDEVFWQGQRLVVESA